MRCLMNKKAFFACAAGLTAAGAALLGYMTVMTRENGVSRLISKVNDNGDDSFSRFNIAKHDWINRQDTEIVTIKNSAGHTLKGWLTLSKSGSDVFVFFAHGRHSDHMGDPANFMRYYVEKGFNFLTVDHRAHGESEGTFLGYDTFESEDSLKWLDYLTDRFGREIKIILHGVSMGGATVCKMVDRVPPQVVLAVADCPYTGALDEFDSVLRGVGVKRTKPLLTAFNALNRVIAGYDLRDTDVRKNVEASRVPMLFVHGGRDGLVPVSMGRALFEQCGSEKELFIVGGADHAQSICADEQGYHKKLDAFIDKYLK